jgi:hypothetical protein
MSPAPKGNKFALGNSGKPKQWSTLEELQKDIDAYFQWCEDNPIKLLHKSQLDKSNKPIEYDTKRPYTIEGLAIFLDCDRDTLLNYEKKEGYEEYFGIIKKAKLKIQQDKVERGIVGTGVASVIIFDLKNNHGYKDKTEVDQNQKQTIEFKNVSKQFPDE